MEVIGQPHAQLLVRGRQPPTQNEQETVQATEPDWTFLEKIKSVTPARNRTPERTIHSPFTTSTTDYRPIW